MVGRVWGKRKGYLVQKDEGRSLGLRGKCKFLGLVESVREDRRKTKVSSQCDKWHKHTAVND